MYQKVALGFFVIVLIAGAYFFFIQTDEGVPLQSTSQTGVVAATIMFTDEGYEPTEITIKVGQAVRWVNASSKETWPASSVHPTHSIYPGKDEGDCLGSSFDSCRGLKTGEMWEFTFTHKGEWRFHDHVHPSKTGVVKVI